MDSLELIDESQDCPEQVGREKSDHVYPRREPQNDTAHPACASTGAGLIDRTACRVLPQSGGYTEQVNEIGGNQQACNGKRPSLMPGKTDQPRCGRDGGCDSSSQTNKH